MIKRRFALLLFCVALLTQIGAPVAGAATRSAERAGWPGLSAAFCDLLHDGHGSSRSDAGSGGTHNHSSGCTACPVSSGAATFGAAPALVFPKVLNQSASPRAPPSRV